jgi:2-polyprenyl-3-methyl-5-hydroxy-6-metoxy-1,4-benzoquinol methylase
MTKMNGQSDDPRHGAKQPERFNPKRADVLDDRTRFTYARPADLLALLDLVPSATLLDFGAGTGLYTIELARARPDVRVLALDEQPEILERLRDSVAVSGVSNVEVIEPPQLDGLRGRTDRVLALNVLHELSDSALADLHASLASAGKAIFVDWNADVERAVGPPRDHVYGPDEAERRLNDAGFEVLDRSMLRYHYALVSRVNR